MKNSKTRRVARGAAALAVGAALTMGSIPAANASSFMNPAAKSDSLSQSKDKVDKNKLKPSDLDLDKLAKLKIQGSLADMEGQASVYVQFTGKGAYELSQPVQVRSGKKRPVKNVAKVRQVRKEIQSKADSAAQQSQSKVLYKTTNALPGVALQGEASRLRDLAKRDDVVKISAIIPKTRENKGTVIDTGAVQAWAAQHQTGKGVTIAVIDSGVDYTHAAFGGPGTKEAYKEAKASNDMPSAKSGLYDPKKYKGGWDLVGDDYNAASFFSWPQPDSNPLDCEIGGHGTHVAGTAAGYGVDKDGKTFRGDYQSLNDDLVNAMRIGPGAAPEAGIVGLRVFGCEGSTNVVGEALDRVLDPNGDGDFSDRAQIVNMSLGSTNSPADDPEADMVNALTDQGILTVIASGNSGDITDIGGAPGVASSALTVANSVGSQAAADAVTVTKPKNRAKDYPGQLSGSYPWKKAESGQVVVPKAGPKTTGCSALTGDDSLKGKWVWLHWSDDPTGETFECGSKARFDNATAAGAKGVILDGPSEVFTSGIAGNSKIPGVQLNKSGSEALLDAAKKGELEVTVDPEKTSSMAINTNALDTLAPSSSRGLHGSDSIVKPDIAAPGTSIPSAGVAMGNGALTMTGTSMATPYTAGVSALVAANGNYSPTEIKNIVMNTAAADIKKGKNIYSPNRVGSGRVMADAALKTPVIAYDKDRKDLVSANFGVVEVVKDTDSVTKTIEVRNLTTRAQTYNVAYKGATQQKGVKVSLDKDRVSVPSKGVAHVKVTVSFDKNAMTRTMDPTMDAMQMDLPRAYVADTTGRVEFTSSTQPTLRVPVTSAPKPAGNATAQLAKVRGDRGTVRFRGADADSGSRNEAFISKAALLELGATSDRQGKELDKVPGGREMDLQYVGATTTAPVTGLDDAVLGIGISTWGNWARMSTATEFNIELDIDGDGKADYEMFNTRINKLDLDLVATVHSDTGKNIDLRPVNDLVGNQDPATFDSNVAVFPVALKELGLTKDEAKKLRYKVSSWSRYNVDDDGRLAAVDETDWIEFDATKPAIANRTDGLLVTSVQGSAAPVLVNDAAKDLLVLHLNNRTGNLKGGNDKQKGSRAQVIPGK